MAGPARLPSNDADWFRPSERARLPGFEMSAKNSCAPVICSADPMPVTQRQSSSCLKLVDIPQPSMPVQRQQTALLGAKKAAPQLKACWQHCRKLARTVHRICLLICFQGRCSMHAVQQAQRQDTNGMTSKRWSPMAVMAGPQTSSGLRPCASPRSPAGMFIIRRAPAYTESVIPIAVAPTPNPYMIRQPV